MKKKGDLNELLKDLPPPPPPPSLDEPQKEKKGFFSLFKKKPKEIRELDDKETLRDVDEIEKELHSLEQQEKPMKPAKGDMPDEELDIPVPEPIKIPHFLKSAEEKEKHHVEKKTTELKDWEGRLKAKEKALTEVHKQIKESKRFHSKQEKHLTKKHEELMSHHMANRRDQEYVLKLKRQLDHEVRERHTNVRLLEEELKQKKHELEIKEKEMKGSVDHELKYVLKTLDKLLGKLPSDEINRFAKSKDFKAYEKVMKRYS